MYMLVTSNCECYVLIIIILLETQMYMQKTAKTDAESCLRCSFALFFFNMMFSSYGNGTL